VNSNQADLRRRQPFFLENYGKPANGARAFRSYGNQQDGVDRIGLHRLRDGAG
jgi:hypothetical protein